MRYGEQCGMRSGCSRNRRQLGHGAASRSRAWTRRPNRRRFQMVLGIRQSVVKHLLIARRNVCSLRHLERKIAQQKRQHQKCARMKHRGHGHLLSGESARANWHITKKFARDQRQMNRIAGKYGSHAGHTEVRKKSGAVKNSGCRAGGFRSRSGFTWRNSIQETFRFEKPFPGGFVVKNHRTFQSEQTRVLAPTCIQL